MKISWSIVVAVSTLSAAAASACPFCDVVGRSLADRRDAAAVVAAGEAAGPLRAEPAGQRQPFTVRSLIRGAGVAVGDEVDARVAGPVAGTALLFGDDRGGFEALAADEAVLGYVAAAPAVGDEAAARLRWFAGRLEDPAATIAQDAFTEFGLAPFAAVVAAAHALDAARLRGWIDEPAIDQRRRGFYGLAVGIASSHATATGDEAEAQRCIAALERSLVAPASDLRAGYDGLLGGLLVARGEAALDWLVERGLVAADTRAGDARHALAALRFAWEDLAESLPRERVAAVAARLLDNPAVAADVTVDLARWRHWASVEQVAAIWNRSGADDPLVRRAVAGYLRTCPLPSARRHAARIAAAYPDAWQAAVAAADWPPRGSE